MIVRSKFADLIKLSFLLIFVFSFSLVNGAEVRVSFNEGFVGDNAANNRSTNAAYLTSFGWSKFKFTQTSATNIFVAQGNDIIGNVVITDANNVIHTIPGYIKWRAPSGNVTTIVFTPSQSKTLVTNSGTYTIDATKYIGLTFIGRSLTITTSGNNAYEVTGNAATSGLLDELNAYLTTFRANDPNGPVTVNSQTTTDQTPTITGGVTLGAGETLSVTVNGVEYTTSSGLVVSGSSWSITIPSNLPFTTYEVVATITNSNGYTLSDNSADELVITQPPSITTSGTLKIFTSCSGCSVNPQSFTVSGSNLTANIVLTAPTGVQLSTLSNSGYSSTVTLNLVSNSVTTTTIYAKLTNNATTASSGTISITSTGATTRTMTVTVNTDNALNFDGVDDKVTIADNNALDLTTNYTIEAWIRPTAFNSLGGIVGKYHTSASNGYVLRLTGTGNNSGVSFDEMNTADGVLSLNKWYHIAAVNSNGTRKLYINGVEQVLTGNPLTTAANSDPVIIGQDFSTSGSRFFNGSIDEVRIWNTAR